MQKRRGYEYELSEVEVVADAALLIVDGGMLLGQSVLLYVAPLSVATRSILSSACCPRLTGVALRLSNTYSASVLASTSRRVRDAFGLSTLMNVRSSMFFLPSSHWKTWL